MANEVFRYHGLASAGMRWFKGNTHLHTTLSDGGMALADAAELYSSAGYDFLFVTDHWHPSHVEAGASGAPLLLMDGIELDGRDEHGSFYHVVCLGTFDGLNREQGFSTALARAREQGGILVLAHPFWTGNSIAESLRHRFDAVEAYNHVCDWLNGKGSGLVHWEAMLESSIDVLGLAADDAHLRPEHPGWNGGWVMVAASELSPAVIRQAVRAGRYYSTQGPLFHRIALEGGELRCETSEIRFARLVGPRFLGRRVGSFDGGLLQRFSFPLDLALRTEGFTHARVEIEDARGRRAWTNTLFATEASQG